MKNLYIDFDGVILDTITVTRKMLDELKIDYKKDIPKVKEFYRNLDWNKLLKETKIINDAIECIKKIIKSKKYEVTILSHVNSLPEAIEKVHFIRQYFSDITVIPVPREISKTKMVHTKDAILIDDYDGNLIEWQENGGISILFSQELKNKGFRVINKLDQILD